MPVHDPQQVASDRFVGADRLPAARDHTESHVALSGRLAVPDRLEVGEISELQEEGCEQQ